MSIPLTALTVKKTIDVEQSDRTFRFLLFVLDAMEKRKLVVDSSFYASILAWAARSGGLYKRIASLLTLTRKNSHQQEKTLSETVLAEDLASSVSVLWEDLFENYSSYKESLDARNMTLSPIRIATNDLLRVLTAEQTVASRVGKVRPRSR